MSSEQVGAPIVTMIGTGAPRLAPDRYGSAVAISANGETVLLDCGPATTYKMLQSNLSPIDVSALLVSHHHYDHTADVANLLLAQWEASLGDFEPPKVIGPTPTARFVDLLVGEEGAFRPDIDARRLSPQSQFFFEQRGGELPRPELKTDVTEIVPTGSAAMPVGWSISTARAQHVQPYLESIAYRVEVGGRSIVYTGDTEYCDDIIGLADGADLLITMCTSDEAIGEKPAQIGTEGAGKIAAAANVKSVILTHSGPQFSASGGPELAIREVEKYYDGAIHFGSEGLRVEVRS